MTQDDSRPRDNELEALATDVSYEIGMFRFVGSRIATSTGADQNAFRESMLIHARCLMDFLGCEPVKDDLAADRYADWSPVEDGGTELDWLEARLGTMIDKRVAHLTAYRQRVPKEQDIFVATVQSHVESLVKRFLAKLHPDKRAWFPM